MDVSKSTRFLEQHFRFLIESGVSSTYGGAGWCRAGRCACAGSISFVPALCSLFWEAMFLRWLGSIHFIPLPTFFFPHSFFDVEFLQPLWFASTVSSPATSACRIPFPIFTQSFCILHLCQLFACPTIHCLAPSSSSRVPSISHSAQHVRHASLGGCPRRGVNVSLDARCRGG
jgi:hypothetical protein